MMSSALKVFFAISLPRSFHDIRFLFPFTTYFLDQFWGGRSLGRTVQNALVFVNIRYSNALEISLLHLANLKQVIVRQ